VSLIEAISAERLIRIATMPYGEPLIAIPIDEVLIDTDKKTAYVSLKSLAAAMADEDELNTCAVCDGHGFYDDPRVPCEHCKGSGAKCY
jgi:hypothetical protein